MRLVLDEWIVREVLDTLHMARTTLLGITGLDSPQEVKKKSANETAITRRIDKAIDIIQQERPEVDLGKEVKGYIRDNFTITDEVAQIPEEERRYSMWEDDMATFARHFYELGLNARKEG